MLHLQYYDEAPAADKLKREDVHLVHNLSWSTLKSVVWPLVRGMGGLTL